MWQPEPGWERLPGGRSGAGIWTGVIDGRSVVVKRLTAPLPGDPAALSDPRDAAYWRREADVALDRPIDAVSGLAMPATIRVEEETAGLTVVMERIAGEPATGLAAATALGALAAADVADRRWFARDVLGGRMAALAHRGGWKMLPRTTLADVADRLWERRGHHLRSLAELPQVPAHGDPTRDNLLATDRGVVGIDWACFGTGPLGADLGYLALSEREDFEVLLGTYAASAGVSAADARLGAQVMAVYTALTRLEWALARAATGPGALAGKYRHPAVAPYIRGLQRLFPQVEALL